MHNSFLHLLLKNGDFLNTDISQGSVATRLEHGGVFKCDFVTNFLLSLTIKNFKNRLIFGEVMGKSLVSCFFDSVYLPFYCQICVMHHSVISENFEAVLRF